MIELSRLYCGYTSSNETGRDSSSPSMDTDEMQAPCPVIAWNVTSQCNLHCLHCDTARKQPSTEPELTTEEGLGLLNHLAQHGTKSIYFTGGEPLLRTDLITLIRHATDEGMRTVLNTNGLLLNDQIIRHLKDSGLKYISITLDGPEETHNHFRQSSIAFESASTAILRCLDAGLYTGLRFTLTMQNIADLPWVLQWVDTNQIPRFCLHHLGTTGHGNQLAGSSLNGSQTRVCLDLLLQQARLWSVSSFQPEIITTNNDADGVYIYLKMLLEKNPGADDVRKTLEAAGGNKNGQSIGCIDGDGTVYPDRFCHNHPLGNVKAQQFSTIWQTSEFRQKLIHRQDYLQGRCAHCRWVKLCNGNLRARAETHYGDIWAQDPACHLTDAEIAPQKK